MMDMSETYKTVYDAYPDAVIIIDYFEIIVMVNNKAQEMFGYDKAELIGLSIEELIPKNSCKSNLSYSQEYQHHPNEKDLLSGLAVKRDGTEFYVEIGLSPIKIGRKNLISTFIRDVNIRKTLELRFHKMVGEVQDYAILFLDVHGTITNWNKGVERITGYSEKEIIGRTFKIFYTEKDWINEEPEKLLDIAITDGRAEQEGWRKRKDGSLFWASDTITTIYDELNHFIGL